MDMLIEMSTYLKQSSDWIQFWIAVTSIASLPIAVVLSKASEGTIPWTVVCVAFGTACFALAGFVLVEKCLSLAVDSKRGFLTRASSAIGFALSLLVLSVHFYLISYFLWWSV